MAPLTAVPPVETGLAVTPDLGGGALAMPPFETICSAKSPLISALPTAVPPVSTRSAVPVLPTGRRSRSVPLEETFSVPALRICVPLMTIPHRSAR